MQFSIIPGHESIKTKLIHSASNGRLAHALMFQGPEGNGSLALALALTTFILCENHSESDSCGTCPSCSKTSSFIHPDVHFSYPVISSENAKTSDAFIHQWRKCLVENPFQSYNDWMEEIKGKDDQNKQGNITAEECRSIIKKLSLKSFEGNKKVMILWLPEFLGIVGNILLKLIEEPAEDTHIILVTEDSNKVLPTIVSRTQIINIPPISADVLGTYLQSNYKLIEKDASVFAFLSKGNISLALKLLQDGDSSYTEDMRVWLQYCYTGNLAKLNEWMNAMAQNGREKIKNFLDNSLYIFTECLHYKLIPQYLVRVPQYNEKFVQDLSKILDEQKVESIYKQINEVVYHIDRNANVKMSLFNLSLKIRGILLTK